MNSPTEPSDQTTQAWPSLRVEDWAETRDTLHMWTQIVGKIRMAHAPLVNHWWQVVLYVSPRGLTTSSIPYSTRAFDIEFDFVDHQLHIRADDGRSRHIALEPKSVADFYAEVMDALGELGLETQILARPNEVDPAIPFADDHEHASYDPKAAHLFWRQLVQADRVMNQFRAHFVGKVSPVHFFWGPSTSPAPGSPAARRLPTPGRAQLRRLGDGGGLLPRTQQLRVLARRRG